MITILSLNVKETKEDQDIYYERHPTDKQKEQIMKILKE